MAREEPVTGGGALDRTRALLGTQRTQRVMEGLLWAAVVAALLGLSSLQGRRVHADSLLFLEQATQLIETGQLAVLDTNGNPVLDPGFPLGYPLFLGVLVHGLGVPIFGVILIQWGLVLLTLALLAIELQAWGVPRWAWLLAVVAYPFPFLYLGVVGSEPLALALMLLVVRQLLRSRGAATALVGAAAAFGALLAVRPSLAITGPVLMVAAGYLARGSWRLRCQRALLAGALAGVALLPLAAYNSVVFGRFWPLPPHAPGAIALFIRVNAQAVGYPAVTAYCSHQEAPGPIQETGLQEKLRELNRDIGVPGDTCPFTSKEYVRLGVLPAANRVLGDYAQDVVRENFAGYMTDVLLSLWRLWVTVEAFYARLPGPIALGLILWQGAAIVAAMGGALLALFVRKSPLVIFGLYPVAVTGLHGLMHLEARYTASVRWAVWLGLAYTLVVLARRMRLAEEPSDPDRLLGR